jgi:Ca2+-binding EF-hand superfamily protein
MKGFKELFPKLKPNIADHVFFLFDGNNA